MIDYRNDRQVVMSHTLLVPRGSNKNRVAGALRACSRKGVAEAMKDKQHKQR
jgi:hypothetical protein